MADNQASVGDLPDKKERAPDLQDRPMRADAEDLALLRSAFERNASGRVRSEAAFRWQYLEQPAGKLFVDFALAPEGERLAAVYASLAGTLRIRGERRLALQSLDTLTDADFRGRGLFVKLAKKTYARAASEGAALVYGFPNGSSAHGFFKKLGWVPLDPIPYLIRPIRMAYVAERLKLPAALRAAVPNVPLVLSTGRRRRNVIELREADPRLTGLWDRFASNAGVEVAVERDAPYLKWRLFDKPDEPYVVLATERGGELSAMIAFVVKDKHGGRVGYVLELMNEPGAEADARHLLGCAVRAMADDGADSILAWCLPHTPTFPTYLRHAFLPFPERLRPIELHAGVCAFDKEIEALVSRREAWYLSYLDSDTV